MENLKNQGWVLSESGLKSIETSGSSKNLIKILLDRDLRDIGAGISDLQKGKFESIDHDLAVLQIMKVRNISAPKANEGSKTAPKLLKLQLTDGINSYSAIEMESTALSIETKPGTKIALKVKQMEMSNGQLLLTPKNIEILGGNVESLVSKWELSRSLAGMKGSRSVAAGGPPPFIPFGQKIQQQTLTTDRGFKSLQQNKQKENENDDSEFKAQRQDAIAEASKSGTKKTFGGGSKVLVDSNVQKIMDKGYTEEQATTALKFSRNNVEKALSNLKKREDHRQRASSNDYEPREYSKEKRSGKGTTSEPAAAKPSNSVSLFDFLEKKIPTTQESGKHSSSYSHNEERFENNISSSFRKHDKDFSNNKSQHWSGGNHEQKSSHNMKSSNNYNNNPKEYQDYGRDYRNNRDSRDARDSGGDSRRDGKYQQQHSNSNYTSKSISSNNNNNNQYQKSSNSMNGSHNVQNHSNTGNKGSKYQKPDYNNKSGSDYNNSSRSDYNNKSDYNNTKSSSYNKSNSDYKKDYNNYSASSSNHNNSSNNNNNSYNKSRANNSSSAPSKYQNDHHQHHHQHHQSNDYQKSNRNVVESMEKMNLKGNQQQYKGADIKLSVSNYPPLAPTTEVPKSTNNYVTKPGGYPIVGFQNKEANEHAKNALKTKNIPGVQLQQQKPPTNWQQPQQQSSAPQHPMPVAVIQQQQQPPTIKQQQPPPPFPNVAQSAPPPAPMHSLPQPFVQHPQHPPVIHAMTGTTVITNPPPPAVFHQTINFPGPLMMQSVQPPPGMAPPQMNNLQQLKAGDLCLAKYWEDGQFYNAKITNVSDSTYVVLFTEYGNAEEVRKSDCVPFIPACPTPPHTANFVPAPQINASYRITTTTQKMQPHPNYHHQQAPPPNPTMQQYKNVQVKTQRRN
ncbi:CLUMA_CG003402, isoform A [Clunio marinus]|uniref:Tudor domain-containing protein 3 n=1 Tax=Clunio marinus TaxID=568069 RepID=A0A1J1HP32_9DIPT|nr:CLUMA_CG003402, isoform A [Clunio marinus]